MLKLHLPVSCLCAAVVVDYRADSMVAPEKAHAGTFQRHLLPKHVTSCAYTGG